MYLNTAPWPTTSVVILLALAGNNGSFCGDAVKEEGAGCIGRPEVYVVTLVGAICYYLQYPKTLVTTFIVLVVLIIIACEYYLRSFMQNFSQHFTNIIIMFALIP